MNAGGFLRSEKIRNNYGLRPFHLCSGFFVRSSGNTDIHSEFVSSMDLLLLTRVAIVSIWPFVRSIRHVQTPPVPTYSLQFEHCPYWVIKSHIICIYRQPSEVVFVIS
jgi:hypothetical protein